MTKDKNIISALSFYFFAFLLDSSITTYGILSGKGMEGDKIVLWLWGIFGQDSLLLKLLYVLLIFSVSYVVYKKFSKFIGLWIPFTFGFGHLMGFSTWLPLFFHNLSIIGRLYGYLGIYGIFILAPVLGFAASFIVDRFTASG